LLAICNQTFTGREAEKSSAEIMNNDIPPGYPWQVFPISPMIVNEERSRHADHFKRFYAQRRDPEAIHL
jgi:hypothetical protein